MIYLVTILNISISLGRALPKQFGDFNFQKKSTMAIAPKYIVRKFIPNQTPCHSI